jgi:putative phosphoserine phosphatase/1-acylglycerol-3-phosphate O-acyltransferase
MSGDLRPRRPGLADVVRTVLTVGAILPGLAVGALWLARTRDRRRAINRTIEAWGDLGTRACGVRLEVTGALHLEQRPAVVVFNHQSSVDPFVLCAILRRDFVGVAKQEIRRNPLLGPAFAFADAVFVDRSDRAQAVRALAPAVDALRRGLAIAIAPEGTRSRRGELGPFKKGAFRIALAARAPILPIVIHNARDVLPRDAWIMMPAVVRVDVLPPLSTTEWTLETLDAHVAQVRGLFEATLARGAQAGASDSTTTGTERV